MENETIFLKNIESYLNLELSEFDRGRILGYLGEYRDSLPIPEPKIVTNEKVVLRVIGNGKKLSITNPVEIMNLISKVSGITLEELTGKDRYARLITPRHVAMYLIRNICNETLLDIGKLFNRDHTTVIASLTHVQDMIDTDNPKCIALIDYINSALSIPQKQSA